MWEKVNLMLYKLLLEYVKILLSMIEEEYNDLLFNCLNKFEFMIK